MAKKKHRIRQYVSLKMKEEEFVSSETVTQRQAQVVLDNYARQLKKIIKEAVALRDYWRDVKGYKLRFGPDPES